MRPDYTPPEPVVREQVSQADLDKLREDTKKRMSGHGWRQQGTQVLCTTCPFHHGFSVLPGVFLTGIDESGNPLLVDEHKRGRDTS